MTPEPSSFSDEELARQSQSGSLAAFEELVYRYERRVYAFVAAFSRNAADVREVTQETFVRAFQSIGQYDSRRPFSAWLFTIARHKAVDHHRSTPPRSDEPIPELADSVDPSELLSRQEETARIWALARRSLSETQYQALWLKYAEDLEVAVLKPLVREDFLLGIDLQPP